MTVSSTEPAVTLLIPCFNAAAHIRRVIASARSQTRPFAEILACDDASQDDTAAILEAEGITTLRNKDNLGPSGTRNRLLWAARTRFIHFHDADDVMLPHFLERLAPLLRVDTAAACAWEDVRQTKNEVAQVVATHRLPPVPPSSDELPGYFFEHFLHFDATIYPREVLTATGGFDPSLRISEDRLYLLKLAASGLRFRYHDEVLVRVYIHDSSIRHRTPMPQLLSDAVRAIEVMHDHGWLGKRSHKLGPSALYLACCSAAERDWKTVDRALRIAHHYGLREITSEGTLLKWSSRYFGIRAALRLKPLTSSIRRKIGHL